MDIAETIGRYQIIEKLGEGGMATVFRAYDPLLDREVALKFLAGYLASDKVFYLRFEREARLVARLEHPHIVSIYDVGVHEERPYLVMRLLRGGTLRQRLEEQTFDATQLWPMLRQVADALDTAQKADIIHRDVKPDNILFDEAGHAYVSDFGIAKALDGASTELTGKAMLGTPRYMSPEQYRGEAVDGRADQYSLAVVAFEILAGQPPFTGRTLQQLMYQHLEVPPPKIHSINHSYPEALSIVFDRALAKAPVARFRNVPEFVEQLQRAAGRQASQVKVEAPTLPKVDTSEVERHYQQGMTAFQRGAWLEAIDFLGRALEVQPEYKDAVILRRRAAQRLQQQNWQKKPADSPPPPGPEKVVDKTLVKKKSPISAPRPRWTLNRGQRFAVGSVLVLLAVLLAIAFWPEGVEGVVPPSPEPGNTAASTTVSINEVASPVENLPESTNAIMVIEAAADATWEADGLTNSLADAVPFDGTLTLHSGNGRAELRLPGGEQLFLGTDTILDVDSIAIPGMAVETELILRAGQLVVVAERLPVRVADSFGAAGTVANGMMGVLNQSAPFRFVIACLSGNCQGRGIRGDDPPVDLRAGQESMVTGDGEASAARPARYEAFVAVAPGLVPTPTNTPPPTATPENTPTPVPTNTRPPRPTEEPTITLTPTSESCTGDRSDPDGDNIPTCGDQCPQEAGPESNGGCPEHIDPNNKTQGTGGNNSPPPTSPPPAPPDPPTPES